MRRRLSRDDSGAALVLVLLIVTVVAVLLAALISFASTSLLATINLRPQASAAYSADGAAQIAINQLRADNFNGTAGGCNSAAVEYLNNFYPATNGAPGTSAAVRCTPDPSNSGSGGGPKSNRRSPGC